MDRNWHPRGIATWPDWQSAQPGQRFEHIRTGARGTVIKPIIGKRGNGMHLSVEWDARNGFQPQRGNVVAPAYDLRPISD